MRLTTMLTVCALVLPASGDAKAQPTNSTTQAQAEPTVDVVAAEKFIRTKHDKVRAVLRQPDTPKRADELTRLLGEFLDYDKLAELSLDREWGKRTPQERKQFVSLLRQLVERQYQRNMESTLEYRVSWVGTEPVEPDSALVKSSARSQVKKRQPPVTIDYKMRPEGTEWRVWDIATDDVSLVNNYKRQFRRVIKDEGWNGLITRMEKKLDEEDDELI